MLDEGGRVVGFVTVDDVIDVLVEEQTEDILRMAGVEPGLDKPYFDNPMWRVVRKRVGWLLLLFVGGTLTGTVLRHFEGELSAVVPLLLRPDAHRHRRQRRRADGHDRHPQPGPVRDPPSGRLEGGAARGSSPGSCSAAILGFVGFLRITLWSAGVARPTARTGRSWR